MQASWAKELAFFWSAEHVGRRSRQNRGWLHGKSRTFDLSPGKVRSTDNLNLNIWSFSNFQRFEVLSLLILSHLSFDLSPVFTDIRSSIRSIRMLGDDILEIDDFF